MSQNQSFAGRCLRIALVAMAVILVALTAVSALPGNSRWIRIFDFPRPQAIVLILMVIIAVGLVLRPRRVFTWTLAAALALSLGYQLHRLWSYLPLAPTAGPIVQSCPPGSRLSVLVANVLYSNQDTAPLLALVRERRPDLILLLETTQFWDEQLRALSPDYPHAVRHARPKGHGMHLFSRLPLLQPEVRYLFDDYRPSITTDIRLRSGAVVGFHGLHPAPPPLKNTARRDAELLLVARDVRDAETAMIVAGDLNDVPWSRTNRLFRTVGGLFDPREGRGLLSTFDAKNPVLRWPLDHVFYTNPFQLMDLAVDRDIGSDHFPYSVELCHAPEAVGLPKEPVAGANGLRAAERVIAAGARAAAAN